MSNTEKGERNEQELIYDFIGYVLTSARGLYQEPQSYGPMRMIDTLENAISLLKEIDVAMDSQSVDNILASIRENRWKAMSDPEEFAIAIDESIHSLVNITMKKTRNKII